MYVEVGLGPEGLPLHHFLVDPPREWDAELPLPTRGMGAFSRDGVWHLVDRVGEQFYPSPADFYEEARRFGVSRMIQPNFSAVDPKTGASVGFEALTEESRLFLVHPRALVTNPEPFYAAAEARDEGGKKQAAVVCPKRIDGHFSWEWDEDRKPTCCGLWWNCLEGGEEVPEELRHAAWTERTVLRKMPSFSYYGYRAPEGAPPAYSKRPALFLVLGISRLVTVKGGGAEKNHARASKASLPTAMVDQ